MPPSPLPTRPSRRLLALLLLALAAPLGCGGDEAPSAQQRPPPEEDPRLDFLLAPCARSHYYGVDTSRIVPILVEALLHGERDPLNRARIELAQQGEEGIEAARRIVERSWNDLDGVNHIRNALDVLERSGAPEAGDIVRRVLDHPLESLRIAALRALRPHAEPGDYDRLLALIDEMSVEFRGEVATGMHRADPERAALQFAAWIAAGEREGLWPALVRPLASATDPAAVARLCALWEGMPPGLRPFLLAPCARSGDAEALAALRAALRAEDFEQRRVAVEAAGDAGLADELVEVLRNDPERRLRLAALKALAAPDVRARLRPHLVDALASSDAEVSNAALSVLVLDGDVAATERALAQLDDTRPGSLEAAVQTLRPRLQQDEALARRVLERLRERLAELEGRPLLEQVPVLQSLGLVPLEEAARILLERSRRAEGTVSGLEGSRWLVLRAGGLGPPGQRLLRAELDVEQDPARRLDLLEGMSGLGNDLARELMLERLESEGSSPYETLYAADRLTRMGPAEVVAPVLKRATLRVEHPDVRPALQCLLWRWYPGPE